MNSLHYQRHRNSAPYTPRPIGGYFTSSAPLPSPPPSRPQPLPSAARELGHSRLSIPRRDDPRSQLTSGHISKVNGANEGAPCVRCTCRKSGRTRGAARAGTGNDETHLFFNGLSLRIRGGEEIKGEMDVGQVRQVGVGYEGPQASAKHTPLKGRLAGDREGMGARGASGYHPSNNEK